MLTEAGTPAPSGGQKTLSGGAITGIVIGSVVLALVVVLFVAAVAHIVFQRRKSSSYAFEVSS